MKLMFYINAIHHGGAERVMTELASALAKEGNQCILVTSFPDPVWEYPLDASVKRVNLEKSEIKDGFAKKNFRRVRCLRKICKEENPDVLISFMPQPILRALAATVGLKIKNVISIRNDPALYWNEGVLKLLSKVLLPRVDRAVFQTNAAKDYYKGNRLYENGQVIFNPVDNRFFEVTYDSSSKRIVSCGRLDEQKNYSLLIKAFAELQPDHPNWTLSIYGVGTLQSALQQQIDELHMSQSIILAGATDNIPEVLSHAGIFVLSSDYEGLPNALMEALAAGVPSISTDCPCGGPKALISDGNNGMLVKVGDQAEMTKRLVELMEDQSLRHTISQKAKADAERFRKEQVINQWSTLLQGQLD